MKSIGEKFGRLTVTGHDTDKSVPGRTWVTTLCDCGTVKPVRLDGLRAGSVVSCGCKKKEHNLRHGHRRVGASDRTYVCWDSMIQRVSNPKNPGYRHYGGRGITVDPKWKDFSAFLVDMGERPVGLELERRDNSEGYHKGNCVWATRHEQMLNTRRTVKVDHDGRLQSLYCLAEAAGLTPGLVYTRVKRLGWAVEKALMTPKTERKGK